MCQVFELGSVKDHVDVDIAAGIILGGLSQKLLFMCDGYHLEPMMLINMMPMMIMTMMTMMKVVDDNRPEDSCCGEGR